VKNRYLGPSAAIAAVVVVVAAVILLWPRQGATPAEEHLSEHSPASETPAGEKSVRLSDEQLKRFGVRTAVAGPGTMRIELTLSGDVALNADRVAHVVPRVGGVVREVRKNLGDEVRQGEVMAVLESRELADATALLLAARERVVLAQSNFNREELLWQKKISPEQDYVQARNYLAEANIGLRSAEQKLRALGFSEEYMSRLPLQPAAEAILYRMTAPFGATVIDKHISLGEVLTDATTAFLIADLSSVWVQLDVQQKDLPFIHVGQPAVISAVQAVPEAHGRVSFLEPVATETSRTIHARVILPNSDGRWRPGMFVTGRIVVEEVQVGVVVPGEALLMSEGVMCVFVQDGERFRLRPVITGRVNGEHTEITSGLEAGETYVIQGAFTLKSELEKPEAEH
jgi:cobalt-zinc-cadmium efflux system membrane fusion protein